MRIKNPLIINGLSLLASLLFPLTAVIGMMAGQIGSRLFSSLFSSSVGYGQIGGEFIFFTPSANPGYHCFCIVFYFIRSCVF